MQRAEAFRLARRAGELRDAGLDRRRHVGLFGDKARQLGLQFLGAALDMGAEGGQGAEGVAQLLQIGLLVAQDLGVVQRADRQLVGVIGPDREAAFLRVELQRQIAVLQHLAVLVAQERDQQLALEKAAVGVPLDVH